MNKKVGLLLFIFLLVFFYGCVENNEGKAITPFKEKALIKDYFSVPTQESGIKIPVNKTVSDYFEIPLEIKEPANSFSLNGAINLNDETASVVIELWTEKEKPLLLYRASYPDKGTIELKNACEETCLMDSVVPKKIKVFTDNAEITIDNFEYFLFSDKTRFLASKEEINKGQQKKIIEKFNNVENRLWIAGNTEVSGLSYAEKKERLLLEENTPLLNDGIFYFVAGYFHYGPLPEKPPEKLQKTESVYDLPEEFDWRDKHDARNPSSPYYDVPPVIDGVQRVADGWLTPVKNQGNLGSCWAFSLIGAREATINLFFNQHINQDLSEQYLVSCDEEQYTAVDEDCFPYQAFDGDCINASGQVQNPCVSRCEDMAGYWGCTDWEQRLWAVKGNNKSIIYYPETPEDDYLVKEYLLEYGPLRFVTCYWGHGQVMNGYGAVQSGEIFAYVNGNLQTIIINEDNPWVGETYWTVKNSWRYDWAQQYGDPGYMNWINSCFYAQGNVIPVEQPLSTDYVIECNDYDNDSYCSWGLSYSEFGPGSKPASCSESCNGNSEEDFDDSNPVITFVDLPRCGDGILSAGEECESPYFPFENYEGCVIDQSSLAQAGCNAEKKYYSWYEDNFTTCSSGCYCSIDPQISSCAFDGSCSSGTEPYCIECFQASCSDGVKNCGETGIDSGGHCAEIIIDSIPSDASVAVISEQDSSEYFSAKFHFIQAGNTPFNSSISNGLHILIVSADPDLNIKPFVQQLDIDSGEVVDLGTVNLPQDELTCFDSDNGLNYNSFGATISYNLLFGFDEVTVDTLDFCYSSSVLKEAYCNTSYGVGNYSTHYCGSGEACRNGHCTTDCIDGTLMNQCSSVKPLHCSSSLSLINDCQLCGCPSGFDCLQNGTCLQDTPFMCGDIDGSLGIPDISDLIYLVNWMFHDGPEPVSFWTANVNGTEGVDIADLVYLVNYMFNDGEALNCAEPTTKLSDPTKGMTYEEAVIMINNIAGKIIIG